MPTKRERWTAVAQEIGVDFDKPINFLSADDIKQATRRLGAQEEPRIMASMDWKGALPDVFKRHEVFMVPLSRGEYAIVRGDGFESLEPPAQSVDFHGHSPLDLETLRYARGESRYLLHALHSGVFAHFTGVDQLYPTVMGKMSTSDFAFNVGSVGPLTVSGAGMEVDMGLEGPEDVFLIEAKAVPRPSFLIRQLYFPLRTFRQVTNKRIHPLFFIAEPESGIYSIWEYAWKNEADYRDIRLIKSTAYRVLPQGFPREALEDVEPDPSLSIVPQANTLRLVMDVPSLVRDGYRTAEAWAKKQGYTNRQGGYYPEAAEALGFIKRSGARRLEFDLTEAGRQYLSTPEGERDHLVSRMILRNPLMNEVYHLALDAEEEGVTRAEVEERIGKSYKLSGRTLGRRTQTVWSYFRWLADVSKTLTVSPDRIRYQLLREHGNPT